MNKESINYITEDLEPVIFKAAIADLPFLLKLFAIVPDVKIFEDAGAKKLFHFLRGYYQKYNRMPEKATVDAISAKDEDLSKFISTINNVDTAMLQDRDYISDCATNHIKRQMMKSAIVSSVEIIDNPDRYAEIETKIRKALEVSFDVYLGMSFKDTLDDRIKFSRNYTIDGIRSGLTKLDECLRIGHGFLAKNLYVIASESNLGKSIALCNFAATALMQNKKVLLVSLEMQEFFIGQRLDAILTQFPISDMYEEAYEGKLKTAFAERLKNVESNIIIKEYPPGTVNVHHLRTLLSDLAMYNDFRPDLIVIDYVNLMQPARKSENRYHELKHISEELRALSYEFGAPVVTASQLNRSGYSNTAPTLESMGESMGIVHTADAIIMLSQSDAEKGVGVMRMHMVKNRLGPRNESFPVSIDYKCLRLDDCNIDLSMLG